MYVGHDTTALSVMGLGQTILEERIIFLIKATISLTTQVPSSLKSSLFHLCCFLMIPMHSCCEFLNYAVCLSLGNVSYKAG